MKFIRRDLLQGASLTALIAASPKEAEAFLHRGGGGGEADALSPRWGFILAFRLDV